MWQVDALSWDVDQQKQLVKIVRAGEIVGSGKIVRITTR
jgi:hypothetical protein